MGVGFFAAFSVFFWDPEGGGGKGGTPCEEVNEGIKFEAFFAEEAICLVVMNRNEHRNANSSKAKHQWPHGGRQTVLVKNQAKIMQPNFLL